MRDTNKQRQVLLICNDVVGERMAGPGIRYWEFARVLSNSFAVTLTVPPFVKMKAFPGQPDFAAELVICRSEAELRALTAKADVIVTLGIVPLVYPFLANTDKLLVSDVYDPFLLSGLSQYADRPWAERITHHEGYRRALKLQIEAADFFICASEKQRDYWLGMLSALGRINPYTHDDDHTLRRLIDVVPFGLPVEPPKHTTPVLKGVYKTIAADDKVILWGGGIWNWFDAPTLIRALASIARQRQDVKLFFMGVERANPSLPKMQAGDEAIALSQELGLYNRYVFFNDWVPYSERQNYLLEADLGVSLHKDHAETRFAFRTRFLDYLWAGLPMVATEGDVVSEQVKEWGLGRIVAAGDVEGVTTAILELLDTPGLREIYRPRFAQAAARYRWDVVTAPLVNFCANPRLAPDKAYRKQIPMVETGEATWQSLPAKAWRALRSQGASGLMRRVNEYLRWRLERW
jgi:glycosyltransferase involved in cell wall biosynthesis